MTRAHATARVRAAADKAPDVDVEFVVSTDRVASDGLIVHRDFWRDYERGGARNGRLPPFLASHKHAAPDGSIPVLGKPVPGSARWIDGEGFVVGVQWAGEDVNPLAPRMRAAVEQGFIDSVSMAWSQSELAPTPDEQTGAPVVMRGSWDEFSLVAVGADAGAKKRARAAGFGDLFDDEPADATGAALAAAHQRNAATLSPEGHAMQRMVMENHAGCPKDKPWALVSKDDETKVLGCHESEEKAKEQEAAIKAEEGAKAAAPSATRLTAAQVLAQVRVRPVPARGALAGARSAELTNYAANGGTYWPSKIEQVVGALPSAAYGIAWDNGPVFTRVEFPTDALYEFAGSPVDRVLAEVDEFWARAEDYRRLGFLHKRGVLLHGLPGTGKSSAIVLSAQRMAERGDILLLAPAAWLADAALHAIRALEPDRPIVCVFEDIDDVAARDERELLDLLDGSRTVNGVLFLATTNYLARFPARLLRAGRLDRHVEVPPPPAAGRLAYLTHKLGDIEKPAEIQRLAEATDGRTYADLRELVLAVYALHEPAADALARLNGTRAVSTPGARSMTLASTGPASLRLDGVDLAPVLDAVAAVGARVEALAADGPTTRATLQALDALRAAVDEMSREITERLDDVAAALSCETARTAAAALTADPIDPDSSPTADAVEPLLARINQKLTRCTADLAAPAANGAAR